jgi:D-glycero-beta-D-manno-heptose 1-phosphate adenylyltransferase
VPSRDDAGSTSKVARFPARNPINAAASLPLPCFSDGAGSLRSQRDPIAALGTPQTNEERLGEMLQQKLKTLPELRVLVADEQARGKTVVFANGCFDLIHVGHIRYLAAARALGDLLIVAVNGDHSVRRLKGEGRPLMGEMDRVEILAALSCVDYLTVFEDATADGLLRELRPDIQAKGTDYTEQSVPERQTVLSYGGRVAIVGDPKNRSTRGFLKQIAEGS